MSVTLFRFPKSSRLYLRKEINELFISGRTIHASPIKASYKFLPLNDASLKMAVAVPKRYFKRATDRNRIKRQVREAFRINCPETKTYFESRGISVHILLVCNCKVLPDYADLTSKIILILQRLKQSHEVGAV